MKLRKLFDRPISDITKMDLVDTLNESTEDCKPSTYNNIKTTVKTVFRYARDVLELIVSSPADALKSRKNPSRERDFWTMEQVDAIVRAADTPEYRLCFAFMGYAGLRVHEAVKVRTEDVRDGFLYVVGKGNKFAKIPISSRMREELERYGRNLERYGMTSQEAAYMLKKAARKALGDSFSGSANPHRLRHSFASNALRAGVNPKTLQKLLRHSCITTTLNIYTHLIDEDLTDEIEKMFR
jgi:site-specific recombinase XerD